MSVGFSMVMAVSDAFLSGGCKVDYCSNFRTYDTTDESVVSQTVPSSSPR